MGNYLGRHIEQKIFGLRIWQSLRLNGVELLPKWTCQCHQSLRRQSVYVFRGYLQALKALDLVQISSVYQERDEAKQVALWSSYDNITVNQIELETEDTYPWPAASTLTLSTSTPMLSYYNTDQWRILTRK
jgi:hypothetical protein